MVFETERNRIERRRGPDFWVKLINWVASVAWIMMLVGLYLFEKAKPRFSTFFDRSFEVPVATGWDYDLIRRMMLAMLAVLSLCTIGLAINSQRHKRRDDRYNLSLIILGVISSIVIIIFCIYFGSQLFF